MAPSKVFILDGYWSDGRLCKKISYQYVHPEECYPTDITLERPLSMVSYVPTQSLLMLKEQDTLQRQSAVLWRCCYLLCRVCRIVCTGTCTCCASIREAGMQTGSVQNCLTSFQYAAMGLELAAKEAVHF
jgi:hypothetical protein